MVGTMLAVNSYVPRSTLPAAISRLERRAGVSHVIQVGDTPDGEMTLVTADVVEESVDGVLADLSECGVSGEEIELVHRQGNRPLATRRGAGGTPAWGGGIAWSELTTASRQYARAVPRYLLIMVCAGVIAVFGVLSRNTILVVGAMAVSPDLLPMCAACVGLADRRPRLAARALGTLVAGLVVAGAAAFVVAALLRLGHYPPADRTAGGRWSRCTAPREHRHHLGRLRRRSRRGSRVRDTVEFCGGRGDLDHDHPGRGLHGRRHRPARRSRGLERARRPRGQCAGAARGRDADRLVATQGASGSSMIAGSSRVSGGPTRAEAPVDLSGADERPRWTSACGQPRIVGAGD